MIFGATRTLKKYELITETANGGYTKWLYKNGIITLEDGKSRYKVLHFVKGMDGNERRVFWETSTLEEAVAYLDRNAE